MVFHMFSIFHFFQRHFPPKITTSPRTTAVSGSRAARKAAPTAKPWHRTRAWPRCLSRPVSWPVRRRIRRELSDLSEPLVICGWASEIHQLMGKIPLESRDFFSGDSPVSETPIWPY